MLALYEAKYDVNSGFTVLCFVKMTELFLNPYSPVPSAELIILPGPGTLFV
jgi:hypothetical protein